MKTCNKCGRQRTEDDLAYTPLQVVLGDKIGWYSGDDGELCGECMTEIIRHQ